MCIATNRSNVRCLWSSRDSFQEADDMRGVVPNDAFELLQWEVFHHLRGGLLHEHRAF